MLRVAARTLLATLSLAFFVQLCAAQAPTAGQAPTTTPASATALVVEGERIAVDEYDAWLLRKCGEDEAPGFAVQIALELEAAQLGLPVDDLVLRVRLDQEIDKRIAGAHGGVKARWVDELAASGLSENGYRVKRGLELRGELLAESIARATRKLTKERVQREFDRRYGQASRFLRVQILRADMKFPTPAPGTTGEQVIAQRQEILQQTKARMNLYRTQIQNGVPFEDLAKAYSDDATTREKGGVMDEPLRLDDWPQNVRLAISFLHVGELSPVMRVDNSFFLMKVLESRMLNLESEKDALIAYLRDAPPDAQEISAVRERAGGDLSPELLPALWAPFDPAHPRDGGETVMRTRGTDISRRAFGAWLRAKLGEERATEFAGERAILREAAAAGIEVDAAEIAACAEEEAQRVLLESFGGNIARRDASIKAQFGDPARWKRQLEERWRVLRPLERLMMQRRRIDETAVRALFEDRYGPGGKGMLVRWIYLAPAPVALRDPSAKPEDLVREAADRRAALEQHARDLVARLRVGEDFAAAAKAESGDVTTRDRGGLVLGHVVLERCSGDTHKALAALEVGGISDPVADRGGYAIYKLDGHGEVEYATLAKSLREELETRRATPVELATEQQRYAQSAKVERGADLLR